jgi:hypothetical protein
MITIVESHPPQQRVTTVTIDLAELPKLSLGRRLVLRLSLALMTRVEPQVAHESRRRALIEHNARSERERLMERLYLSTVPRR